MLNQWPIDEFFGLLLRLFIHDIHDTTCASISIPDPTDHPAKSADSLVDSFFEVLCSFWWGPLSKKKYEWVIDSVDFWVFIIITSMRRHNVMMLSRERTTISINIPKWSSATANYLQHFDTIYLCYTMLCILLYFLAIST